MGAYADDRGATDTGAAHLLRLDTFTPGLVAGSVRAGSISTDSLADGAVTAAKIGGALAPSQIPGLDATKITTGTLADTRLSANVALLNSNANFVGSVSAPAFSGRGALPWQLVSGPTQQMTPNNAYMATGSTQTVLTLPAVPVVGDVIRISGIGASGWKVAQNAGQTILTGNLGDTNLGNTGVWSPHELNRNWWAVASSADGTKLVATVYSGGGQIYTSTDSGTTWTPRESNRQWDSAASSADGTKLAATERTGYVYTSTNSGITWTRSTAWGNWTSIASSADGTRLAAASWNEGIWTSTNSGVTWNRANSGSYFYSVASSSDGNKLVAGQDYLSYRILTSADGGANWTVSKNSMHWPSVASSADGIKLAVTDSGGKIYTSPDSGMTWTPCETNRGWTGIASSADGSKLAAVVNGGRIYLSSNGGATWAANETDRNWSGIASSSDGKKLIAVVNGGQIFTYVTVPSTTVGSSGWLAGQQGSEAELQYLGNGQFRVMNASGSLSIEGRPGALQLSGNGAGLSGVAPASGSSNYVAKAGDTMTGTLNLPANGLVAGTSQLVLSGGNIGIGTTSPAKSLHLYTAGTTELRVEGATRGQLTLRDAGAGADLKNHRIWSDGGIFAIETLNDAENAATRRLTVDAAGNVGIGTTTPAGILDVRPSEAASGPGSSVIIKAQRGAANNVGGNLLLSSGDNGVNSGNGYVAFGIGAVVAGSDFSAHEAMRIANSGNVGIGTPSPQAKLHVSDAAGANVLIGAGDSAVTDRLTFFDGTYGIQRPLNQATLQFDTWNRFVWAVAGSEKMRMDDSGNVGIGTASPGRNLEVYGASSSGIRLNRGDTGYWDVSPGGVVSGDSGDLDFVPGQAGSGFSFRTRNAGGTAVNALMINQDGNVGIGTPSPQAKLHLVGPSSEATELANARANAAFWLQPYSESGWGLAFGSASPQRQYLQAMDTAQTSGRTLSLNPYGGNVGIGTTSPGQRLDVNGVIRVLGGNSVYFNNSADTAHAELYFDGSELVSDRRFWVNSGGLIVNSGNVGIGTTAPQAPLHIVDPAKSDLLIMERASADSPRLMLGQGPDAINSTIHYLTSSKVGSGSYVPMTLWTSDIERLRIATNGNVGIGTTSPTTKLEVAGTIKAALFVGDGSGLTNIAGGGGGGAAWQLAGNSGTTPGTQFLGTTDNQPLEVKVNGARVLRLEPNASSPNLIGGHPANTAAGGISGATIAGGGSSGADANLVYASFGTIGGGQRNLVGNSYGTVGGGLGNYATGGSATVGGGQFNFAQGSVATVGGGIANYANGAYATVGGGYSAGAYGYASAILGGVNNVASGDWSTVGGGGGNIVTGPASFSTVSGGQNNSVHASSSAIIGGGSNVIQPNSEYGVLGGGYSNTIQTNSDYVAICGGQNNYVATGAHSTVLAGGASNHVLESSPYATLSGGYQNEISYSCAYATIGGGYYNRAWSYGTTIAGGYYNFVVFSADFGTIGGGVENSINPNGYYGTIPGGRQNTVAAIGGFAAGNQAKALHTGCFVWGDWTFSDFASSNTNQFLARASGGVKFYSDPGATVGVQLAPGGTGWSAISDRNVKANFEVVDTKAVLQKVANLPVTAWNMKTQDPSIRHYGPMAQDFYAAFGIGEDNLHINSVDADGVALAAIQGLNEKVESENAALRAENVELKARLDRLEQLINARNGGDK